MKFTDLVTPVTQDDINNKIVATAKASGLKVTSWAKGSPTQQIFAIVALCIYQVTLIIAQAIMGQFIDLATDPGDTDGQASAPGWLSYLGESLYGTVRIRETAATGFVTLINSGGDTHFFAPYDLTFQNDVTGYTYKNSEDDQLYATGEIQLSPGQSITIPIHAEEVGTVGNATPGDVATLSTHLEGVTVSNSAPVLGSDTEPRAAYVARCKLAAAATSPNGPRKAYEYIALSARSDGTFGASTSGTALNVTRVQVTRDSDVGEVSYWIASKGGTADSGEFSIIDSLIQRYAVPDCVTCFGAVANEVLVDIDYSVDVEAAPGLTEEIVTDAIEAALTSYFSTVPIGGYNPIDGVGNIYRSKLKAIIGKAHDSIFSVDSTIPMADVALNVGDVGVLGTITFTVNMVS